ncbi:MAG: phosphoribosylamine--glycine ligase [Acidobacteria bacterium]|nr:phosphoribosylamine--glycine ligase [Acidobacteriota bacterium]
MKILVVGSGGREHAICAGFARSSSVTELFCANGNAGIASIAECVDILPTDIDSLVEFTAENRIDLTFVGGETPLALGIVDRFAERGLQIVGPPMAAARLESSKAFAKDFMTRYRVPTAQYAVTDSIAEAKRVLNAGKFGTPESPIVVKADGLAAGKGVIVATDRWAAMEAVDTLDEVAGSAAASKIIIEERLVGREVSLLMFADGADFALMPPARDHKRIGDGDTGPNTGGMGTITDDSLLSSAQLDEIVLKIVRPTLAGCTNEGFAFRGILFLGLMMTDDGAKVLEYNVRFGDPETQSILVRLNTDLVEICESMLMGNLAGASIKWLPGSSATIVLAAEGYPSEPKIGDPINGIREAESINGVSIFHAATAQRVNAAAVNSAETKQEEFTTSGGRVLGVTATGDDLPKALDRAYSAVSKISWRGMQYRRDIGASSSIEGA